MRNNITIASHAGFCFGVNRATDALDKKLKEKRTGERIYTLGHIIHNENYVKSLEERGVLSIEEKDILPIFESTCESSPTTIFIRAHGIPKEVEQILCECKEKNEY